ncbi:MAG: hypothetical protein IH939_03835 [Acidobacteria bacterium]|nr:hypothetical protein [Acidobacteriota bacterium]
MKRASLLRWTPAVAAAIACLGLLLGPASAQKKKKTRIATTHQLMEGLVFANCKALGGELKKEKTNFKAIAMRAALLNEAGHVLMADGRCPDGEWAKDVGCIDGNRCGSRQGLLGIAVTAGTDR